MRWLIFLFFCLILCAGCSLPLAQKSEEVLTPDTEQSSLFNIRLERWGVQQFSGLLALRNRPAGLSYVLLDATGMKLLEGEIYSGDDRANLPSGGVLKESSLAGFFAQSLENIFLSEPSTKPCGWSWLLQLCSEEEKDHVWRKTARLWPFTLWQVVVREMEGGNAKVIQYSQPWLGTGIFLENIRQN